MSTRDIEDIYPLSPIQRGLLFHCLYRPEPGLYSGRLSCTLKGDIDPALVVRAGQALIDHHPVFRTAFVWEGLEEPMQVVLRRAELPLEQQDWSPLPRADQELRARAFLQADRLRGFDLTRPPLLRLALCRLAADELQLVWSFHHLIMDGWSESLVLGEFAWILRALSRGETPRLPPAQPYGRYIAWLRRRDLSRAEELWRRELAGFTAPTPLGAGRPDASAPHGAGERVGTLKSRLPESVLAPLQALARRHRLTLNTLVQGAWALLLGSLSGKDDVVFGSTISSRPSELEGVELMVGPFINTLPVRVHLTTGMEVMAWLKDLQDRQVEVRQHAYTPLVEIQGWSEVPRGQPLFESILVFQNGPVSLFPEEPAPGVGFGVRELDFQGGATNYPVTFEVDPGEGLEMAINYDRGRFGSGTAARWLRRLETIFGLLATGSPATLGEVQMHVRQAGLRQDPGIQEDLESAALRKLGEVRRRRSVSDEEEAAR